MSLGLIWAQTRNGVIGRDGAIPWHIREDMARFSEVTAGSRVIMGRSTWDSIPPRFRPLPGRENVVLTRQPRWRADGAGVVHSLDEARAAAANGTTWIMGGAGLYAAFIGEADRLEVTEIDADIDGDTYAPAIADDWRVASTDPVDGWHTAASGLRYRWLRYER